MFDQPKRSRTSEPSESHEPSPVIHLRNLPPHTLELDLINLLSPHGAIREIAMLPQRKQALVEFQSQEDAEKFVDASAKTPFFIGKEEIPVTFSNSKHVVQRTSEKQSGDNDDSLPTENRVLLFTVFNALHPITIDLLKTITAPFARLVRIVMFGRAQIRQAMLEFPSVDDARTVKRNLNGADIYSGCCTLKVDYARPDRLKIARNDLDTWDFDLEGGSANDSQHGDSDARPAMSLLGNYTAYGGRDPYHSNGNHHMAPPYYPGQHPPVDRCLMHSPRTSIDPTNTTTPVVMVYKLNMEKMNCDRLFNILCPYGNVIRIKFLRTSDGVAMVEMGDSSAVEKVRENLSGVRLFGNNLSLRPSRQTEVAELGHGYFLPDGSPSFKDFKSDKNNRFLTPKFALKNRPFKPSRTLHFWNCPPQFNMEDMKAMCAKLGAPTPIKLLTYTKTTGRTSSGLVEWEDQEQAMDSLAIVNHSQIPDPENPLPFIIKLSFAVEMIRD